MRTKTETFQVVKADTKILLMGGYDTIEDAQAYWEQHIKTCDVCKNQKIIYQKVLEYTRITDIVLV
jgi:hypothetical protein